MIERPDWTYLDSWRVYRAIDPAELDVVQQLLLGQRLRDDAPVGVVVMGLTGSGATSLSAALLTSLNRPYMQAMVQPTGDYPRPVSLPGCVLDLWLPHKRWQRPPTEAVGQIIQAGASLTAPAPLLFLPNLDSAGERAWAWTLAGMQAGVTRLSHCALRSAHASTPLAPAVAYADLAAILGQSVAQVQAAWPGLVTVEANPGHPAPQARFYLHQPAVAAA